MSDELRLPCKESGSPDDWFIARDGKQYPDEEFIHIGDVEIPDWDSIPAEQIDEIVEDLEKAAKQKALIRRRKARDACHQECLFRTRCLDLAITLDVAHGTWGGYYEEEIRVLQSEIKRRRL